MFLNVVNIASNHRIIPHLTSGLGLDWCTIFESGLRIGSLTFFLFCPKTNIIKASSEHISEALTRTKRVRHGPLESFYSRVLMCVAPVATLPSETPVLNQAAFPLEGKKTFGCVTTPWTHGWLSGGWGNRGRWTHVFGEVVALAV